MDIILLFPGQGSQKPGMGRALAAAYPEARDAFAEADAALGEPLSALCFEGDAETLTRTQNAQPALLAHGIAAWRCVRDRLAGFVRAATGHSLGECTAYAATGALSLPDAVRLVRRRGELMNASGLVRPGTMAAILGDTSPSIDAICAEASAQPDGGRVVPANYNAPGQVVISGDVAGVEAAMDLAKQAGAKRAIRLAVSGAFHSPLMEPARDGLAEALAGVALSDPDVPVYANVTAAPVRDAATARRLLLDQLTAPVRWTELVERLVADFPGALFVELGPGTVLSGLVRKIAPGTDTMSCGAPADVDALVARVGVPA